MDTSYLHYETVEHYKQGLPKKNCLGTTVFISTLLDLTAEDLLYKFVPFGCVISVQKIVKYGHTRGKVTYSNADDAAAAVRGLDITKGFLISLLDPREVSGARENKRSQSLLKDGFRDMPPRRLPSPLDTLDPPDYSERVCLRVLNLPIDVDERQEVLNRLPRCVTNVKVHGTEAIVTLTGYVAAAWLMDYLYDLYTGLKCLHVSVVSVGGGPSQSEDSTLKTPSVSPREVREAHENERSESPSDQLPSLLKDGFRDVPPQRLPSPLDLPAYSESVCLRVRNLPKDVSERRKVLSLLPPLVTNVKVQGTEATVTLTDFATAMWLMDFLYDLHTGSKRLRVTFEMEEGRRPGRRTGGRKRHQQHQGRL